MFNDRTKKKNMSYRSIIIKKTDIKYLSIDAYDGIVSFHTYYSLYASVIFIYIKDNLYLLYPTHMCHLKSEYYINKKTLDDRYTFILLKTNLQSMR